ncbi:MAG: enoyl-CoA hydratase/isomerase family protein [Hyphomicrobiaceae bacterium]
MKPGTERILIERYGPVAIVRLNRPDVLNAIDQAMWQALLRAFEGLRDERDLRVCLITGNGRGFCSGADLKETAWKGETAEQSKARIDTHHQQLARAIVGLPVPVVACVNGYALGGGLEIALAADIRIASREAKFGFPEAAVGRFITGGASLLLQRAIGPSRAKLLLYTSDHISASEALSIGLVDEVVEPQDLLERGKAIAGRIANNAPHSIQLMKRVLDEVALTNLEDVLAKETQALVATYGYADIDDAARAFNDRGPRSQKG